MVVVSCILGHTVSMIKEGKMTQKELYDKFLKLSVRLDNMYQDSDTVGFYWIWLKNNFEKNKSPNPEKIRVDDLIILKKSLYI